MTRYQTIDELAALLVGDATVIGLDLGTKTIGVAVSDLGRRFASPLAVIRRTKFKADADALVGMIGVHRPAAVVIGLPINMDGSEGPRAQATRAFARNLAALIAVPIVFWDERLSTAAVTRTMLEADLSRKRQAEVVDKMAAAYILQGALDRLARL